MLTHREKEYLARAIELSAKGVREGKGGPFGCVIVQDGIIIGEGYNSVTSTNDPTAHAEVVAIRQACARINHFQLTDCEVYTSCEPCPMCLGAIYWARPKRVVYANSREEAAAIEFDDDFIYREIHAPNDDRSIPFIHVPSDEARKIFEEWKNKTDKISY